MTQTEIEFLEMLFKGGPVLDSQLEAGGFTLELVSHLQARNLVQHDNQTARTELSFVGLMEIPRPNYYRLREP